MPELAGLFREMSAEADGLAAKIVSALANHDPILGAQLDNDDDALDELHRRSFSPDWPLGVEAVIDGGLLGRYYERYADHAVTFGHHVVFLATGKTA